MTRKQRASLIVGCAGLGLSGCVAAVIPVAASGLIGRSKLHRHAHGRAARQDGASPTTVTPQAAPTTIAQRAAPATIASQATPGTTVPPLRPVPADLSTMTIGQTYTGSLPSPTGAVERPVAAPTPPSPSSPIMAGAPTRTTGIARPSAASWSDVMHYTAAALGRPLASSVLLARGSDPAAARWLPCGDKPTAVLVTLPGDGTTRFFSGGVDNIAAIRTMGATLVFASDQPMAVVARQLGALKTAGIDPPVAGTTLFLGRPGQAAATRATIGERYCVAAIVGSRAADFPDSVLPGAPGANPGWFLIR